jgi:DNA-directed RNA polymerase specialized sigma24 family protein
LLQDDTVVDSFTEWATEAEPRLRHALTASFGPQVGKEAAAEALSLAWERWDQIKVKDNPTGYVYGIGRNKARRMSRVRKVDFGEVPIGQLPEVEPGLPAAMADLPDRQRTVLMLLHGYQWTMSEVAALLGTTKSTIQKHAERGLARLRNTLGVES